MAQGDPSLKKENLRADKLKQVSSPGRVASLLNRLDLFDRKMTTLTQKLDNDTDVGDTDYEATIDAVQ